MLKPLAILLLSAAVASAQFIPSTNRVDWTPGVMTGVPGGIPTNRVSIIDASLPPYNADKSGSVNASAAIQSAINAALSNNIVFLPAGTYLVNSTLTIPQGHNGITLRGAGTNLTKINFGPAAEIDVGNNVVFNFPLVSNIVTSGNTKGSTNITIANNAQFAVGRMIELAIGANNTPTVPSLPYLSVYAYDNFPVGSDKAIRRQQVVVTAKTGTTGITFWPPLYDDYSAVTNYVYDTQLQNTATGIENMFLECSNSTAGRGVFMNNCYGCWVSNVVIHQAKNYDIYLDECQNCEVRHCTLDSVQGNNSNGSGLLLWPAYATLVEDNILINAFPGIEVNGGSSGNAFVYNFVRVTSGHQGTLSDHEPHECFNIYEGNFFTSMQWDSYTGSASQETIYRNWITGEWGGGISSNTWNFAFVANRFCRYFNLVGNIMGTATITNMPGNGISMGNPNIGNGTNNGTNAPPFTHQWTNWPNALSMTGTAVTSTSNVFNSGYIYNGSDDLSELMINGTKFEISAVADSNHCTTVESGNFTNVTFQMSYGQTGWQEFDTDVSNTLVGFVGNYNYKDHAIPASQSLGGTNLQNSYVYTVAPAEFLSFAWPWVDPTSVGSITPTNLPAGWRFVFGSDPAPPVVATNYGVVFTHP